MKHWRVDYSINYIDGRVEEKAAIVEARNITVALGIAINDVTDPLKGRLDVTRATIWNIGIMEDDVFPEEGDPDDH